jgi:hypothetical protein
MYGVYQHRDNDRFDTARRIATALGDKFHSFLPVQFVGDDFYRNLHAVEALYICVDQSYQPILSKAVQELLDQCEVDVGVRWDSGKFIRVGARLLDDRLVNDVLKWLRQREYQAVLDAFVKGLGHLLASEKEPSRASDVITDMYEALEAMAKKVTERDDWDLSQSVELFISKVKASDGYKRILKEYVAYANGLRHAARDKKPKPEVSTREAESFVYLTGLFIRLAMR